MCALNRIEKGMEFFMSGIVYHIIFFILSIFVFLRCVAYGLYEWKEIKNRSGGATVILFAIFVTVFSNVMVWIN